MNWNFVLEVFLTVLSLLILIIPGYIVIKIGLISPSVDSALSCIVLYVCQPMLMIMSYQKTEFSNDITKNMLIVALLCAIIHILMIALIYLLFRKKDDKTKVLRFASVFSNVGYMGIPFLQMLFPNSGEIIIYGGIMCSVFNLFNWSIGVYMYTNDKKDMSIKKVFLNPVIIGAVIGVILFIVFKKPLVDVFEADTFGDRLLTKLTNSMDFLSNMVTPLSMIVIGIKLAKVDLKRLFFDKTAYVSSLMKLIVMSIVTILVVAFLPVSEVVKSALFFGLSMPSATATVLFAVQFKGDSETASISVLLSTVLSVITIPLMYILFSAIALI